MGNYAVPGNAIIIIIRFKSFKAPTNEFEVQFSGFNSWETIYMQLRMFKLDILLNNYFIVQIMLVFFRV